MLGQVPDLIAPGDDYLARIRPLLPQYHPEKGCLARTVAPDKPEALTGPDGKARLPEKRLGAVGFGKVVYDQHGLDAEVFLKEHNHIPPSPQTQTIIFLKRRPG